MPTFPPYGGPGEGAHPIWRRRPRHARPWGGFRTAPDPITTGGVGPRSASFTQQRPGGNLTLDALMARQKAAVAGQQEALATPQATIAGGLGQMLTSYMEGLKGYKAEQEEALGREELAEAMTTGYDPATGIFTPEAMKTIMQRDPDIGVSIIGDMIKSRRDAAKQEQWVNIPTPEGESGQWQQSSTSGQTRKVGGGTEAGGPKITDESGLRQDFIGSGSYKRLTESEPVYQSMLEAADDTSAASDLNLVYGIAKLYDPTCGGAGGRSGHATGHTRNARSDCRS